MQGAAYSLLVVLHQMKALLLKEMLLVYYMSAFLYWTLNLKTKTKNPTTKPQTMNK